MNNKLFLTGVGVLVVVLIGGWYWANSNSQLSAPTTDSLVVQQTPAVTHSLVLTNRKLTPEMVTVAQGDHVTVKVMSDESGEFHISGYEIENDMIAGAELSFSFTADKAGRYNFELHPKVEEEDIVIGAFVVNPR